MKSEKASFHMPGHKGIGFFVRLGYEEAVSDLPGKDITEIFGADDLRHAEGVIKIIADDYSELYGSRKSFISVNGSSALIMAAIMTCVSKGHKIIASSDSHISVKNGIELAGAEAIYIDPITLESDKAFVSNDQECNSNAASGGIASDAATYAAPCQIFNGDEPGIPGGLTAETVRAALDENDDVDAVILPSPNYFGIVSDIEVIAEEIHKKGKVLIVDQAHGAHLKMLADAADKEAADEDASDNKAAGSTQNAATGHQPVAPAEACGADIVIDSTHKTLASFTQSAVAILFGDRVDPNEYEQALLTLESTSPSYILMNSLAVNADIMKKHGSELAEAWREDLSYFYGQVKYIPGVRVMTRESVRAAGGADFDETKIVLDFSSMGMSGEEAEGALIEQGIYPEFHTGSIVMCLTGIGNTLSDYDILLEALRVIGRKHFSK